MDRRQRQSPHSHSSAVGRRRQASVATSDGNGGQGEQAHDDAAGAAAPTPQSPQQSAGGSYHVHQPHEQRRQKIVHMAQKEEEDFQRYKEAQREQQGSFRSVSQQLGTVSPHGRSPPDLSAVRSAQQQQSRIAVMTKSTRDQAKRERFREETRRQEEEKNQRHKEKQRLKAQELELRTKEREWVCQTATRRHWEDTPVHTEHLSKGSDSMSTESSDTHQPRSKVFPSQHAKHRQYREDQRRAEEAENERHKASQRQKGEYLKGRAEEEGRRVQEDVRRAWAGESSTNPMQETGAWGSSYSPAAITPDESTLPQCDQGKVKSALRSPPTAVPQTTPAPRHDHRSLNWPSNKRPANAATASSTTYGTRHLTDCQATLCSLGVRKLSMVELDVLLKHYNGNMDRLANCLLSD